MEQKPEEQKQVSKKTFRKSTYRGIELTQLLDLNMESLIKLFKARQRRRFSHGLKQRYDRLLQKLRNAKKNLALGEKPKGIKTHLRDAIVLPEMVHSIVEVYGGKTFNVVEIKPDMVGHYLGEFSLTYKPVRHGKPGIGASGSKFAPLK